MDDSNERTAFEQTMHIYRRKIDALTQEVKAQADMKPVKGGAEITLSFRALQQAKMWLGKALEEYGSELPQEYADKA